MVDIQPDGDLMFDAGALWIAAKYQIPMLIVMHNNRAYYNDWEHQIRMAQLRGTDEAKAHIGMDLFGPEPDFGALARSMGCYGEGPIDKPEDVRPALLRAIAEVKKGRSRWSTPSRSTAERRCYTAARVTAARGRAIVLPTMNRRSREASR